MLGNCALEEWVECYRAWLSSVFALLCPNGFHDSPSHPKPMAGLLRKCVS